MTAPGDQAAVIREGVRVAPSITESTAPEHVTDYAMPA